MVGSRGVREPRGLRIGDCVLYLDRPAVCNGRRVRVVWLDGLYYVGGWLCDEDTGYCVRAPALCVALRVALRRLKRKVGVVRARAFY